MTSPTRNTKYSGLEQHEDVEGPTATGETPQEQSQAPQQQRVPTLQILLPSHGGNLNCLTGAILGQALILVVLALAGIRLVMAILPRFIAWPLLIGLLGYGLLQVKAAYEQRLASQQEALRIQRRMEGIRRERQENEALVEEAARMMLDINRRHLEEFLQTQPTATYEEWIADLHPENIDASGKMDHRFYVPDSDHLLLWKELTNTHPINASNNATSTTTSSS